ncbi:NF-kappa-B inhibitor cactus-like isoform X2 [Aricia agestis]|uniref:NF-kappa-B inhibitor cactus-like isoform X2 n=1 Tax=Aricia agestis TaxID=91739 RepID=UPI001C205EFE|nr:NF-kappa-B inhibitor cactus-like isoform X2 [Aricia agestis]
MSAKRVCDTKIPDEETTDSGYLSGPLSSQLLSSDDLGVETEREDNESERRETGNPVDDSDKKVISESELDSGLDLSESLSHVKLDEDTETQHERPVIIEPKQGVQDIPLKILFQPDEDGDTQVHIAAVHGCEKSVGTLIRVCPDKRLLDIPNDYGHTPLHLAVMSGHHAVTRMLVLAGASLDVRDRVGETPIHKAVHHTKTGQHIKCLLALLAPAPELSRQQNSALNQKNYNGQMCVHLAASAGHLDTLRYLVNYGADINAREGLAGSTALHIAVRRGDKTMTKWLLERCSSLDSSTADYGGRTPRRLAKRTKLHALFGASEDSDDDSDEEDDVDVR